MTDSTRYNYYENSTEENKSILAEAEAISHVLLNDSFTVWYLRIFYEKVIDGAPFRSQIDSSNIGSPFFVEVDSVYASVEDSTFEVMCDTLLFKQKSFYPEVPMVQIDILPLKLPKELPKTFSLGVRLILSGLKDSSVVDTALILTNMTLIKNTYVGERGH